MASELGRLRVLSVNHRTAELDDLERLAFPPAARSALLRRLREAGVPAALLCTCHRTELYWRSRGRQDDSTAEAALRGHLPRDRESRRRIFVRRSGRAAAIHLFRVAAGLESLVLGEAEVSGQVRDALAAAKSAGAAGPWLEELFRAALRFAARAHAQTAIGSGALSVASAAVRLLAGHFHDLRRRRVLILGAGATGMKAARHLRAEGVGGLLLVNRTLGRAREAARELGASCAALRSLPDILPLADAVVAAVQVESPLLTAPMVAARLAARRGRALVLVDLSLPRAIDPACARLEGVALHDLSGLEAVVASNRGRREREIPRVEACLALALSELEAGLRASAARPLVAALHRRAEAIRRDEVARARARGALDARLLERVTRRLVNRLLEAPSEALRAGGLALDRRRAREARILLGLPPEDENGARD
jgi:glutamyl-tRNA reductase